MTCRQAWPAMLRADQRRFRAQQQVRDVKAPGKPAARRELERAEADAEDARDEWEASLEDFGEAVKRWEG